MHDWEAKLSVSIGSDNFVASQGASPACLSLHVLTKLALAVGRGKMKLIGRNLLTSRFSGFELSQWTRECRTTMCDDGTMPI